MNTVDSIDSTSITKIFLPIFQKICQMEESVPFKAIVKSDSSIVDASILPMDLSDVEKKLLSNLYKEPWKFISDVWMLFENAWLYNKKSSKVYQYCSKIAEVFEREMNEVMRSLGYCCGRWYLFDPPTLKCSGNQSCSIPKNARYYGYNKEFNFCSDCFTKSSELTVLTYNNKQIGKENFKELKNNSSEPEPFAECNKCGRKVHEICVLYVKYLERENFICNVCELCAKSRREKLHEQYSAKNLPITKLSQHIQDRVDRFLKSINSEVGHVTIRVVASSRKYTNVKNVLKRSFAHRGKFPDKFPYTAKTVFVFYEVDKVDVAIFALHVQEYDNTCPEPNSRRVYISYLDSVNFFQPKEYRTDLYFEILLGYMEYTKKLGYKAVHVWACPPPDGDDYLFYRHPEKQKSPDHNRLEEWYNKLFQRGIANGIILNNLNILDENASTTSYLSIVTRIPYFENDFWPDMLEDSIKKLEKANNLKGDDITEDMNVLNEHFSNKLSYIREESKEIFFVFQLHFHDVVSQLPPIDDPDPPIQCDFMEDRETFLIMCQEKNHEFSTIRRAKFTSLVLLYELHTHEYEKSSTYTCNICSKNIIGGYHCKVCDDYDLCARCWRESKHEHEMEYLIADSTSSTTNTVESTKTEIHVQNDTEKLIHARLCKDKNCEYNGCARIKRLISHFAVCSTRVKNTCALCRDLITMCWHHAKYCVTKNCVVPTCKRIKEKLKR